jgi:hypothetical protein
MTNAELVKHLNELKIKQTSCWEECIPEEIWDKYFENKYKTVKENLDIDKRRWYESSISVIKINDDFIGIRSITNCYNEQSSFEDFCYILHFCEMEEVMKPTYIKKQ